MKPVDQIISSLENEPENWSQDERTLKHNNGVELWTANLPFFDMGIYRPRRKISILDKIKLQIAVNNWHKKPLYFPINKRN